MRTTKQQLQTVFKRLVMAMNKRLDAGSYNGYVLEHDSLYGYLIVEYDPLGGENHPFGSGRRNAREMFLSMYMTCEALEIVNRQKEGKQ